MNYDIFFLIHSLAHKGFLFDWFIVFFAETYGYLLIVFVGLFLFFHKEGSFDYKKPFKQIISKSKEAIYVFFVSLLAWSFASVLKDQISSPRPFLRFSEISPLFTHGGMDSFPSGHAMFFSALAMSVYFYHKKLGIFLFGSAIVISICRVASGIHFPVDIFFGFIFGILVAIFLKKVSNYFFKK